MPEPITVGLGMAVGKAVLKTWLKDNEFASSATDSLSEMVSRAVTGWDERNATLRQMERISQKAVGVLQPIVEFEWPNLSSDQRAGIANAVQNTIDELRIDARLLASLEFDPTKLSVLIESGLSDLGIVGDELELGIRLAQEAAQLIVDIGAALPSFTRDSFAEILNRESEIINSVDRLFDEVKRIRDQSSISGGSLSGQEFEDAYRRSTVRRLDRIELFGLNAASNSSSRQHNLSTAYISLSVAGSSLVADNDNDQEVSDETVNKIRDRQALASVRAEEIAGISNRIIVKGEAGSGKTTLLQSLAVRCAASSFKGDLEDWNSLVPFFIPLRALTASQLPTPEQFPGIIAPSIAGAMPQGWVHEQLQSARALILVDGLDEVSEHKRDATRKWVEDLLGAYPDCRMLITSRPPAIPDGWLASLEFTEIELLPMSPDDVSSFIDHWHEAVAGEEREVEASKKTLALGPFLKDRIRSDRSLRELASSPLLCAMLCAMNRDRKEVLPSNRLALYEAATHMILHARDEQRKIRVSDLPTLDFETKRDLLQDIAFWMMENGLSMADEWRVIDLVTKLLPRFPRIPADTTAALVVKALLHRSGILRSPVEEKCDFIHNAFKEYLAARAVSEGDRFGYLEGAVATSEAWREVAPMAAAITDDRRRTAFLHELIKRGDNATARRVMYHLLAVRCLETCTQLEPEIQDEIRSRIGGLRQPRSVGEAKALSAAGDLATNLVRKTAGQHARTAAACVRTLRLIGSPAALDALEPYGPDPRNTVAKELIAAWPFFDRNDYARRVLSQSRGLWNGLRIDNAESLEGVRYLQTLHRLDVRSRSELSEDQLDEFSGLKSLRSLQLRTVGMVDLSKFRHLDSLNFLYIDCEEVVNFSALSELIQLHDIEVFSKHGWITGDCSLLSARRLSLSGEIKISDGSLRLSDRLISFAAPYLEERVDVSFLYDAINLNELTLAHDALFSYLYGKKGSGNRIRSLQITRSQNMEDLRVISLTPELIRLQVRDLARHIDLSALQSTPKLTYLSLRGHTDYIDLSPIAYCKSLKELSLAINAREESLEVLRELPQLSSIMTTPSLGKIIREMKLPVALRLVRPPPQR